MKTVKTDKSYRINIKEKYLNDKENGLLRGGLHKLTPRRVKNICLNFDDENLSIEDKRTVEKFFELKNGEDLLTKKKRYDTDGFRPICNFLKGGTETIQQHYAIELIAIIIDFNPRPYNRYYKNESYEESNKIQGKKDYGKSVDYISEEENKTHIPVKPKNKTLFAWYSSVFAMNTILFKVIIATTFTTIFILFLMKTNSKPNWMVWKKDHYVEVNFNLNKYDLNQLKLYKEDRILNFKQITPDCNTRFFNTNGHENLWYGKNKNGELEYFTDLGLHPETEKTLKKITKHIITKYICKTF